MPKYLAKLSRFGGQHRITIPRLLIKEIGWHDAEFIILEPIEYNMVRIRRFVDRESLKTDGGTDSPEPD